METVQFPGWMKPAEAPLMCTPARHRSVGDEGRRDTSRTAQNDPKPIALKGTVHTLGYVSLHTLLPSLPPTYSYVLSISTQLVSSSAGFPGAVNEQKSGLYDHNNQLSFLRLLSSPPQAREEWLQRKVHEFFYFPDWRVILPGQSYLHCSLLLRQQVPYKC